MSKVRSPVSLLLAVALVATACSPQISDTGLTGTWSREGLNVVTTISIVNLDGAYRFRWGRDSLDGHLKVRCDWDGHCEETFDGKLMATYQMRTWVDEESGLLRVECRGVRNDPDLGEVEVYYLDELSTKHEGTTLISRVRGKDGVVFEGRGHGRREFKKVSDSVVDPPKGDAAGG